MLCRNGGAINTNIIGLVTNGGFAEYIAVPQRNVFKIPDEMQWELSCEYTNNHFDTISCIKTSCVKDR